MKKKLNVGVVGAGYIVQFEWLPYLQELDEYKVVAISDISRELVEYFGELYNIPNRFTDWREVVNCKDVDAVLVLNNVHAEVCLAAAVAKKDILVEKPLCESPEQAKMIAEAVKENNVILMVGEMKRYDPGYRYACERIKKMKNLRMIRARDYSDRITASKDEIFKSRRRVDVPDSVKQALREKRQSGLRQVTGDLPTQLYSHLLGAGVHDMEIMRAAFGEPQGVDYCDIWADGASILAVLNYGENVRATFEIGYNSQKWYEEELIAFGEEETIRILFPHPYVKNCPTKVQITRVEDGAVIEENIEASFNEAFRLELQHFYECVTERKKPDTSVEEGKRDIEMLAAIFEKYAERRRNS